MPPPKIGLRANDAQGLEVLREYAEFWKIPYIIGPGHGEAKVVLSSGRVPKAEGRPNLHQVISPSGPEDSRRIADDFGVLVKRKETVVSLPVSKGAQTLLRTNLYNFDGPRLERVLGSEGAAVLHRIRGTQTYLLSVDLVGDYEQIFAGLEDSPSLRFRIATVLPFSYHAIPRFIRDRSLKSMRGASEITQEKLGPIECLRTIFLASIVIASDSPIPRIGFWRRGKTYALSVTHDIESRAGLEVGALRLLEIERILHIRSSWSIVTNRYPLSSRQLTVLGREGEICAHDTEHDGRLLTQPFPKKVERLKECKKRLELSTGTKVRGFRSPLLQHNRELVTAVGEAGYEFDSSVPSWEALSPTSLNPHGVGTVFPFRVNNVLEIPVSLPQDHQLLRVGGLSPTDATETIVRSSNWIRELGGLCVLLVHPDYDFGGEENKEDYLHLLEGFSQDGNCQIMTLGEMASWWASRGDTYINSSDGDLVLSSRNRDAQLRDYQIQQVAGYDDRSGFRWESLS